jgi:hypothetical protein
MIQVIINLSSYEFSDMPLANPKTDTFQSMRVECTKLIGEGLSKHITKHIPSMSIVRPSNQKILLIRILFQ